MEPVPAGEVIVINPVVEPWGTVTIKVVADADCTLAAVPLNETVSCEGVLLKLDP